MPVLAPVAYGSCCVPGSYALCCLTLMSGSVWEPKNDVRNDVRNNNDYYVTKPSKPNTSEPHLRHCFADVAKIALEPS